MPKMILVVEDDRDFALQLASMFEFQGLDVGSASTGPAALRAFAERPVDLVLVDVMLPQSHGLTVVDQLRGLPGGSDVPVILMSAVYGPGDVSERDLDRLGVLKYLSKPFSLMDLGRQVTALLDSPDGGRDAVRALRDKHASPTDSGGVDIITDSMTAIPDFVAEALADMTDDGDTDVDVDTDDEFVAAGHSEDADIEVNDDEFDEFDEFDLDAEHTQGGEIDFATGSMAALTDEDLPSDSPSGSHSLGRGAAEISQPQASASSDAPKPATPRANPLADFELEVDIGMSGSFAPVDDTPDVAPAPKGDPAVLVRLMAGQDALPHRVVSALVAAHLTGAAGRLRLKEGDGHRDLLLLNGYPVWASTTPFESGLPAWLVKENRITGAEGAKVVNLQRKRGWAVPRILAAIQRFRPGEVDELLQAWVTDQTSDALSWSGRMTWLPGDAWSDEVPIYEGNPVRALWPSIQKLRLGRVELDLAHLEGKVLTRTADALRLLDRLPATTTLNRLQATLARPTSWDALLPHDVDQREEALRLLWLLDAAGCLTEEEGADVGVEEPRSEIETRRIPRSVIQNLNLEAGDDELRIQDDWLKKMQQGPYEFLDLPDVVDARGVRAAYARMSKRWRLDAEASFANADTPRKAKELQSKLRASFQDVLRELEES